MVNKYNHIESGESFDFSEPSSATEVLSFNKEEKDYPPEARQLISTIETIIQTHLRFESRVNEGQQALIYQIEIEPDQSLESTTDAKVMEEYLKYKKSLKVMKVSNPETARREFEWHFKAYQTIESLSSIEKANYLCVAKPDLVESFEVNFDTKEQLNKQNARLESNQASVLLLEWIEGEDLLTRLFRLYLSTVEVYKDKAFDQRLGFQSLLLMIASDFRTKGLDFSSMDTLGQYKRLLQVITKHGKQLLSADQLVQIENTINLLHRHQIYHNDLHLRNFLINPEGKIYMIDFGRSAASSITHEDNIQDNFVLNLLRGYKTPMKEKEDVYSGISSDILSITNRIPDQVNSVAELLLRKSGDSLDKELKNASSSWTHDSWNLKKFAASVTKLQKQDQTKARFITDYIMSQVKTLSLEHQNIAEWLDGQI